MTSRKRGCYGERGLVGGLYPLIFLVLILLLMLGPGPVGRTPMGKSASDLQALAEKRFEQVALLLDDELGERADQLKAYLEQARSAFRSGSVSALQQSISILVAAMFSLTELGRELGLIEPLGAERLRFGLALLEDALVLALSEAGPIKLGLYAAQQDSEERVRVVGPFLKDCPSGLSLSGPQGEVRFELQDCRPVFPNESESP